MKSLSRVLTKAANKLAIDALFRPDLEEDPSARPVRPGTILGVSHGKLYVQLDHPAIEVKVYVAALLAAQGDRLARSRSALFAESEAGLRFAVGDGIGVRVARYDGPAERWMLDAVALVESSP